MLSVEKISFAAGGRPILKDVSCCVHEGEILGLVGPSGAGKTTLLRCISGLQGPASGRIIVDERDVTAEPIPSRPVSFMQQAFALYEQLSILENVVVTHGGRRAPRPVREEAVELLRFVGISESTFDSSPNTLSGGEAQRVALCKTLMKEATVLLLDEPFSNLDKRRRRDIGGFIRRRAKERRLSVVMVSHDEADILFLADCISIVQEGTVVQVGKLNDLHENPRQEQAASFGIEAGLQVVRLDDLGPSIRWELGHCDRRFQKVEFLGWRPDRSVLQARETDTMSGCSVCLPVTTERTVESTGGTFIQLSITSASNSHIIWHFQPAHIAFSIASPNAAFICIQHRDLLALDSQGRVAT
jgi:ABC-type sugar transport system ATPase subunit